MKAKIAIYLPTFLNFSETFIYKLITSINDFEMVIFCREQKNQDKFPFDKVYTGKDVTNKRRMFKIMQQENIVLIHAQYGTFGADILGVKKKLGVPLITHFRGQDAFQLPKSFAVRLAYRGLFKHCEQFLTVSEHMKHHLVELGCKEDKIESYYGGIDLDDFKYMPKQYERKNKYQVLMCGRLVEKKGYDNGLKAIAKIGKEGMKIKVNIVGDGPLCEDLKKSAHSLGIASQVEFFGSLSYADVKDQLQSADLLLAPYIQSSSGDSEGIPNILKEALAVGLPVVTTAHSGIPELVEHGLQGLVAPENDLEGLINHLRTAFAEYYRYNEMSSAGRKKVEQAFSLEKQTVVLESIYGKLIRDYEQKNN